MVFILELGIHQSLIAVFLLHQVQQYVIRRSGPAPPPAQHAASCQREASPPIPIPTAPAPTPAATHSSPAHSQSSEASFVSAEGDSDDKRDQVRGVALQIGMLSLGL